MINGRDIRGNWEDLLEKGNQIGLVKFRERAVCRSGKITGRKEKRKGKVVKYADGFMMEGNCRETLKCRNGQHGKNISTEPRLRTNLLLMVTPTVTTMMFLIKTESRTRFKVILI